MPEIPSGYQRLEGSERHPAGDARLLGPVGEAEEIEITVWVRRRPDASRLPDTSDFLKPHSGKSRRIPQDEFAERYGAAPEDLDKVVVFLETHGIRILERHLARRTVRASGTAAQMEAAFVVPLSRYEHRHNTGKRSSTQTEVYRGRDGFIHIPSELASTIVGVFGLDNRNITKRNAADPPNTVPLNTKEICQLYDFPPVSASGQVIGIVSCRGYLASDLSATFNGSPPQITDVQIDRTNNGQADSETTQDICIAGLAAPDAEIAVYFLSGSEQSWLDMLSRIAHPSPGDPQCSVISCSFYICDGDDTHTLLNENISQGFVIAACWLFQEAAIQGVTICIACGDTGSSSKVGGNPRAWSYSFAADGKAHVQFPGSCPWVLSVGGTTIGDVNFSPITAIAGGTTIREVTSFTEYVWNDPSPDDSSNWGTTGGGISDFFLGLPSYQNGVGVPVSINDGHQGRGVPDVSANASSNSGYGGIFVNGNSFVGNGTSASAPLWAGLIARINAALGKDVGFVNPALYSIGSRAFRDIVPGAGPANNSNSGVAGYPAGPGWDACTGWGSPNGGILLSALSSVMNVPASPPPAPPGDLTGTVTSG